jgi:hypothetical protein
VITGPATDNEVGSAYVRSGLGLPAHNARHDAPALVAVSRQALEAWQRGARPSSLTATVAVG